MQLLARLKAVAVPDTPPPLSGYDWYANFCMNLNIIHGQKREKNGVQKNCFCFEHEKRLSNLIACAVPGANFSAKCFLPGFHQRILVAETTTLITPHLLCHVSKNFGYGPQKVIKK